MSLEAMFWMREDIFVIFSWTTSIWVRMDSGCCSPVVAPVRLLTPSDSLSCRGRLKSLGLIAMSRLGSREEGGPGCGAS